MGLALVEDWVRESNWNLVQRLAADRRAVVHLPMEVDRRSAVVPHSVVVRREQVVLGLEVVLPTPADSLGPPRCRTLRRWPQQQPRMRKAAPPVPEGAPIGALVTPNEPWRSFAPRGDATRPKSSA